MPPELHTRLQRAADADGLSLTVWLTGEVSRLASWPGTDEAYDPWGYGFPRRDHPHHHPADEDFEDFVDHDEYEDPCDALQETPGWPRPIATS